eukprot:g14878.t1
MPSPMEVDDASGPPAPPPPAPPPRNSAEQPEAPGSHSDDDDERLDTRELRRGLSANLERMENVLRDPTQLAEAQRRDPTLGTIRAVLEKDRGDGTDYVLADNHLLWHHEEGGGSLLEHAALHDAPPPSPPWEVLQMDIQDFKVPSDRGNRFLLAVVGENVARVMQHLCTWMKVSLDYGPVNHPRGQGAVERTGGSLHEALSLLCRSWPRGWDDYVPVATWIHRVTPDPSLPGGASTYQILFGRAPRSRIDLLAQPLDGPSFGQGLATSVEEQHHMTQEILAKRPEVLTWQRERHHARIAREPPGAKAQMGDLVLVGSCTGGSDTWAWEYHGR